MAMLDAILCPDWQYRYFSFNGQWAPGEQMGSMRTGQGDHWFALFNASGCWLKGFDPNCRVWTDARGATSRLLADVPADFAACLTEPAFVVAEATFCL